MDSGADVNATDEDVNTALMLAAMQGDIDTARVLLKAGVDIDVHGIDHLVRGGRKASP